MRFLLAFAGLLVVIGAPLQVRAAQAGAPVTVMQDADPLSPLSPLDRTVTLALERVSLKAALDAVARQTGVRIAYSRRVVPLDRPVSVQLDAVRVEAALDTLLHGTGVAPDRKSTRLNSSHSQISYAVFCLKKKKNINTRTSTSISIE